MKKILVAGATGYLGGFVAQELKKQDYFTKVLVRNKKKIESKNISTDGIIKAQITDKTTLKGCCENMDVVFSSVGITTQKNGLTYMDVDYQANLNLLEEAEISGVKKFIYVSVLKREELRDLKIYEAKEKFAEALKTSGLNYCIIRPNGFFSDMSEFYDMAQNGRIYLFGNGEHKINPIHGEDLATICVNSVDTKEKEISIGGPQVLTHKQIAKIAFSAAGKKANITHIPNWLRKFVLLLLRTFTSGKTYGPVEFFMTVLSMDLLAPEYGEHTLKAYFEGLKEQKDVK
jgi:uncharacterized protein YbjT (DUF2867 family)